MVCEMLVLSPLTRLDIDELRTQEATRMSAQRTDGSAPLAVEPEDNPVVDTEPRRESFPEIARSAERLAVNAGSRARALRASLDARAEPKEDDSPRSAFPPLLLVDSDRVMRTAIARDLLRAGFEVTVVGADELREALQRERGDVITVLTLEGDELAPEVRAALQERPEMALLLRSESPVETAQDLLMAAGARNFEVIDRRRRPMEVVAALRRFGRHSTRVVESD
jgi:hypothetical protein